MSSAKLHDLLPTPSHAVDDWVSKDPWFHRGAGGTDAPSSSTALATISVSSIPPYGKRDGFQPRTEKDFVDGGAFPEIHYAQFPLNMGKVNSRDNQRTLALQVDGDGKVQYDAVAKVGVSKGTVVFSKLAHTRGMYVDEQDESVQKPDEDAVRAQTEKTRQALEKITKTKLAAALPVLHAEKTGPAQYIRYTPSQQGSGHAAGSEQRIIRMVEEQKDPMEPPRFQVNKKIPRAPPSPPAPVMHSPTRKVTAKEQADWKIPPCISNWKNNKGYTIALDKRLAADGRGLQQTHINENFAKLSEALFIADRKAREAVEMRSQLEKRMAQKKKEEQEEQMRELARAAREQRQGIRRTDESAPKDEVAQRDEIRRDRLEERRRDRNIARAAPSKQAQLRNEKDRDISEKIALGLADPKARGGNDGNTQFDDRLFNQSKGIDSGAADDETYAVYDKPWRAGESLSQKIYRPSKNVDNDIYGQDLDKIINTNRFVPDKGFSGADTSGQTKRDGPVQFEKNTAEDDPFGLGQLLETAKAGTKRKGDDKDRSSDKRRR